MNTTHQLAKTVEFAFRNTTPELNNLETRLLIMAAMNGISARDGNNFHALQLVLEEVSNAFDREIAIAKEISPNAASSVGDFKRICRLIDAVQLILNPYAR